ncbi:sigma-54 dependent transcriptional regulator [Neptunicella marina]|uniref:Sigma-54-dependent Fis family transcriptional regulator n=1 Tax=Neptunicella marina TaxID=2125989 RepID=A0A8J6IRB7_9ALTE|nr:sigma-54 dependent transcriptional regulator [Neptunicella marina]MBC3765004.1 sigma-54-dependent Fis family transcriptional regulator [Neptunicella marina]
MNDILVISTKENLQQSLNTVLTFMGESCTATDFSNAAQILSSQVNFKAVIVDAAEAEHALTVINQFALYPFITLSSSIDITPANVVGELCLPATYPELTKMLHRCQEYITQRPTQGTPVVNKTKLFRSLIGKSAEIQQVRQMIEKVAPTEANVLILGESGTGKEVVARNLHYLSVRKDGPFIPVNCGAIPAELLESELFGHEKGAFTGAVSARKGRFELAEGGTLFLDEIGDMPLQMQVKMLRVLQERTFERVGGAKSVQCNVRVIAATHRDLETMVEQEKFREDLFYRLNVFPIETPALRERKDDIPLLLQELISRVEKESGIGIKFTQNAMLSLMEHNWPGNVRELSNLVERLTIMYPEQIIDVLQLPRKYRHLDVDAYQPDYPEELLEREAINALFGGDDDIELSDEAVNGEEHQINGLLASDGQLPPEGVNLKEYISELEIAMIKQALEQQDWVVARSAELLGMRRTTLVEKMRKYDLTRDDS